MILAKGDLPAAVERIRTAIDRRGAGYAPLSGAGLESLLEVLEGRLPGQTSLSAGKAYADGSAPPESRTAAPEPLKRPSASWPYRQRRADHVDRRTSI